MSVSETMPFSSELVERIVADVMRELSAVTPTAIAAGRVTPQVTATAASSAATSAPISLHQAVISEDVLAAASAAGRAVAIPATAIITPSGRDYIRRRSVQVVKSSADANSTASGSGIVIVRHPGSMTQAAATAAGWSSQAAAADHAAAAAAAATVAASAARPVVCSGGEASVIACLLNRNTRVRAAVVSRDTCLQALFAAMSPQILCLDASPWTFSDIFRLLRTFRGSSQSPLDWRELTGESRG